ncbi:hypothetical protein [Neisseria arctica]|uniref:hypothetical protein n=1 Tax=Neisseria arctica TaxID=1470200 RepID=UPI00064AA202|nr:hypothetical protein [Neisseria arctica]UOO87486.1 hypothetical protein LVJ86_04375 [Neisseria arctica]
MKYQNMVMKHGYCNTAHEDGVGSGAGGTPPETFTAEEVEKLVSERLNEAVAGLKAKNGEVIGDNKKLKEQLAQFDGIDPAAVKAILQRFSDDEEAKLIAEGKIDEVLNKRTERMKTAHEKQLAEMTAKVEAAEARAAKFTDRVLGDAIRAAGSEAGIHKTAFEDAIFRAKTVFDIDDDGNAVAKDGVFGKDGKPLTLKEWFGDMQESAPHWFPMPQGAGARGSGSSQPGQKNPWKKETFNLTEQGQIYRENPELARQLAAQAGQTI